MLTHFQHMYSVCKISQFVYWTDRKINVPQIIMYKNYF